MGAQLGLLTAASLAAALAGCSGLSFDGGRVEVRLGDDRVAWADTDRRRLEEGCERVKIQKSWFVGVRYARTGQRTTLTCRFSGRFFVHVQPTYSSESGEVSPDGSAVYLVVGPKKRTLVASASVTESSGGSDLQYSRRYCSAA